MNDNKKVFGIRGLVPVKLIISLTLLKEFGYELHPWKIIKLNKSYNFDFFNVSKSSIYKYAKLVDVYFNEVKNLLKKSRFLEEYK